MLVRKQRIGNHPLTDNLFYNSLGYHPSMSITPEATMAGAGCGWGDAGNTQPVSGRDKALLLISVKHIIDCNKFILCGHIRYYNCILVFLVVWMWVVAWMSLIVYNKWFALLFIRNVCHCCWWQNGNITEWGNILEGSELLVRDSFICSKKVRNHLTTCDWFTNRVTYITAHHITSRHITSECHITPYHITSSYHATSNHNVISHNITCHSTSS